MQRRGFTREQKQKCGLKCSAKRDSGCLVSVKIRIFRVILVSIDIVARVCAYHDGFFKCTQPRTNGQSLTGAQNVSDNKPNVRKSYDFADRSSRKTVQLETVPKDRLASERFCERFPLTLCREHRRRERRKFPYCDVDGAKRSAWKSFPHQTSSGRWGGGEVLGGLFFVRILVPRPYDFRRL